jgi:hypothetical protein
MMSAPDQIELRRTVSESLRKLRREARMSREQFAIRVGMSAVDGLGDHLRAASGAAHQFLEHFQRSCYAWVPSA